MPSRIEKLKAGVYSNTAKQPKGVNSSLEEFSIFEL
jgi:hypothetical protein